MNHTNMFNALTNIMLHKIWLLAHTNPGIGFVSLLVRGRRGPLKCSRGGLCSFWKFFFFFFFFFFSKRNEGGDSVHLLFAPLSIFEVKTIVQ